MSWLELRLRLSENGSQETFTKSFEQDQRLRIANTRTPIADVSDLITAKEPVCLSASPGPATGANEQHFVRFIKGSRSLPDYFSGVDTVQLGVPAMDDPGGFSETLKRHEALDVTSEAEALPIQRVMRPFRRYESKSNPWRSGDSVEGVESADRQPRQRVRYSRQIGDGALVGPHYRPSPWEQRPAHKHTLRTSEDSDFRNGLSQGSDGRAASVSRSLWFHGLPSASGERVSVLAPPQVSVCEQRFVFEESRPVIAGSGLWLEQAIVTESRVFVTGPGAATLDLQSTSTRPRLYLLCSWPAPGEPVLSGETGLVPPVALLSHPAFEFAWVHGHGQSDYGVEAFDLVDGVGDIKAGYVELLQPFISSGLERWGFPRPIAQVVGKGGATLATTIFVEPWVAPLRGYAIMLNVASLVLPYGDVGAWPSARYVVGLAKKHLIKSI